MSNQIKKRWMSILKNLTEQAPHKNNSQSSCSMGYKSKEDTKNCSSEETIENLWMISRELKKDDETKYKKQRGISMEL